MAIFFMRQRGSVHVVAIFATLAILSTFVMFGLMGVRQSYIQEKGKITRNIQYLEEESNNLNRKLQEIESLSGFFHNRENRSNFADISQAKILTPNLLGQLQKVYNKEIDLPTLAISDVELAEKNENSLTLEKAFFALFQRIQELQDEIAMLRHHTTIIAENKKLQSQHREELTKEMENWLGILEKKSENYQSQFSQKLAQTQEIQKKAEDAKNEAVQKAQEIEESMKEERASFEEEIGRKKNEIRKLQAQKYGRSDEILKYRLFQPEEDKPDGRISFVDSRTKTVYIDLGQEDGVLRGLKFEVYRHANKATKNLIGRVEVQKVMTKVSMAVIIEYKDALNPIVPGDVVVNPIFSRPEPIYIALAGNFTKMENASIQKLIEQLGAVVEPKVTVRTNLVVHAPKSETNENYRSATTFGVPLMAEDVLLRYVGD